MKIIETMKAVLAARNEKVSNQTRPVYVTGAEPEPLTFVGQDGQQHTLYATLIHPGYGTDYDRMAIDAAGIGFCEERPVLSCEVGDFRSTVQVSGCKQPLNSVHFEFRDEAGHFVDIYGQSAFQVMPY